MDLNGANAQHADMVTPGKNKYLHVLGEAWQRHLHEPCEDAPTVISTFSGCGGSTLGYSMAGFRELLAVEVDASAIETFRLNFTNIPTFHGDIQHLSTEHCKQLTGLGTGQLDVLDGSPPCQGFSMVGKRIFSDDRNQLFQAYIKLLRGLKPKAFVMENVAGMVSGEMKFIFKEILKELKASGYRVKAYMLNAMYFCVPQTRKRVIFIGVRHDLGVEPCPPPT